MGGNTRAGSSPAPSNLAYQKVKIFHAITDPFKMGRWEAHFQMTLQGALKRKKSIFFILWVLCILNACLVLPYALRLGVIPPSVSFIKVLIFAAIQSALFFGVICWLSYILVSKTDLSPFSTHDPFKRIVYPGMIVGVCVGFIIYLLEISIFKNSSLSTTHPPCISRIALV